MNHTLRSNILKKDKQLKEKSKPQIKSRLQKQKKMIKQKSCFSENPFAIQD